MANPIRYTSSDLNRTARRAAAKTAARVRGLAPPRPAIALPCEPHEMEGVIAAVGFSSGNRVVIGHWRESPIGRFSDVMWAEPDDWRTLVVATEAAKSFVTAIYEFDTVIVAPELLVLEEKGRISVGWAQAQIGLRMGRPIPFPPRGAWLSERIERPIAKMAMGVDTHGVSPTGVVEAYRARRLRRVTAGQGRAAGRSLGEIGPPRPRCGFGFSEPPPFASVTELTTLLADPTGRLDEVLSSINGS